MTKDEALKLALEALDGLSEPYDVLKAQEAIKEALAQPEQEPFGYFRYDMRLDAWVMNREGQRPGTPFYTTPPQRKPPQFPTMLRKMWSGTEVQEWINENWSER